MQRTPRLSRELVEIETMLAESKLKVVRSLVNMRDLATSGLPTSTPGNGSPGTGKGGGRTITIDGEQVPMSSAEASVLTPSSDLPLEAFADLLTAARKSATAAAAIVIQYTNAIAPDNTTVPDIAGPIRLVMQSLRYARLLSHLELPDRWHPAGGWNQWTYPTRDVWKITQRWGFIPTKPAKPDSSLQRELLANDLTGRYCRRCKLAGHLAPRDTIRKAGLITFTYELCNWCRTFEGHWGFLAPVALIDLHHRRERITEDMIEPYRQAHLARQKQQTRRRRKGRTA